MQYLIYENRELYVEKEDAEVPWLKIFTKEPYKELTELPEALRKKLWRVYEIIEKEMLSYYKPTKINMASFANMLPRVHIHVMARFKEDSYFPNPMWGEKLRKSSLDLPNEEAFHKKVFEALNREFRN
ncbi:MULTISPECIES: HIT family protein [Sulfurimonas]|uniref:HIT family protein n=1 Tax=Sulfurimonas TaxID=202746 RepID=UPI0012652557|nr:HIT family protein [Sulfurimonas indica]